jgi:hypothetical protein
MLHRVRLQFFERNKLERGGVSGFQINRSGQTSLERSFPARDTDAPFVARFQTREAPFRMRRDQIVSIQDGEIQKLARHLHADGVLTNILSAGATITVAVKTGERVAAATLQFRSENVRTRVLVVGFWILRHAILDCSLAR